MRPAGLLYVGLLLSWTRMEEPFAATLLIIVPAAGRGHVRPVVPPLVNRLGLARRTRPSSALHSTSMSASDRRHWADLPNGP